MKKATIVAEDIHFGEGPGVGPDGKMYVSDFYAFEVLRFDQKTWAREVVAKVPAQPSGLGWLPDGRLLIVSMLDFKILRLEPDGKLVEHADVSGVARGAANEMRVDQKGRAWVGSFGFDFYAALKKDPAADPLFGPGANPPTAEIALVDVDGTVTSVASGMRFPNGTVQLSDDTMIIAETCGSCLTAFTIGDDGKLTNRRVWADMSSAGPQGQPIRPDGICVDAEDAIWVSDPNHHRAVRIVEGGKIVDVVATSQGCFAVALGGGKGKTLVCCTAETSNPNIAGAKRTGRLEIAEVPVPAPLHEYAGRNLA